MEPIRIYGARQHNLKNIDLEIPRNRFVVITGVSGSGKSSLAFDTLFAEGQRRYVESLSTFARQFLQRLDMPQVDEIQGLAPAIAIEQKGLPRNPRSTVGTLTEIHDHLRLLYARLGTVFCPECGLPITAYTIPQMVKEILEWPDRSRLLILAPMGTVSERALPRLMRALRRDGFARLRIDGKIYEVDPPPSVARRPSYRVDVVADRLVLDENRTQRLSESLEAASNLGKGKVEVVRLEGGEKSFIQSFQCARCGRTMPEPTPSLFSFHHMAGMCPLCQGLGTMEPDKTGSSARRPRGSVSRWRSSGHRGGDEAADVEMEEASSGLGSEFEARTPCPQCMGTRLNEAARSVRLGGRAIHEISRAPIGSVREWLLALDLSPAQVAVADRPKREVLLRLDAIEDLGLSYLTLERSAESLSGGEAQRIRLANQIGSPLSGVLYVLDEPSIGLHPRDHERLLGIVFRLRDAGNTVLAVEHDRQTILRADHVIDLGPGAGPLGGEVVFSGPAHDLVGHPASLTGLYLSGDEKIPVPPRRPAFSHGAITLAGARGHNLKSITVRFPLGCFTCVTGVSGSGKSTLVMETLYRILARRLNHSRSRPAPFDRIEGDEAIHKVILIDQAPIGRTPRSTPATYTGLFSSVRQLFSSLPEAKARGYAASRFSFNVRGGRCEACKGEGLQKIEMFFLPDVYVTCPICEGTRYNPELLEIGFKGRSIAEVLMMTVNEAAGFFENIPAIRQKLETLQEVGLGYLSLGQPGTTLSGGEAQRVKLSAELSRRPLGNTLYILDEPTTGLHFDDIRKLLHVLQRLVDLGHTVVVIEHHLDVIKTADYVVDLGPQGGDEGGYVVAAGAPEDIVRSEGSITGRYLEDVLVQSG